MPKDILDPNGSIFTLKYCFKSVCERDRLVHVFSLGGILHSSLSVLDSISQNVRKGRGSSFSVSIFEHLTEEQRLEVNCSLMGFEACVQPQLPCFLGAARVPVLRRVWHR